MILHVYGYVCNLFLLWYEIAFLLLVLGMATTAAALCCWCLIAQLFLLSLLDSWYLRDSEDCHPPILIFFHSSFNGLCASASCYYLSWDITDSMRSSFKSSKCQDSDWNERETNCNKEGEGSRELKNNKRRNVGFKYRDNLENFQKVGGRKTERKYSQDKMKINRQRR